MKQKNKHFHYKRISARITNLLNFSLINLKNIMFIIKEEDGFTIGVILLMKRDFLLFKKVTLSHIDIK